MKTDNTNTIGELLQTIITGAQALGKILLIALIVMLVIALIVKIDTYKFHKGGKFFVTIRARKLLRSWVAPDSMTNLKREFAPKVETTINSIAKRTAIIVQDDEIKVLVPKSTRLGVFGSEAQIQAELKRRISSSEFKDFLKNEFPDASFGAVESDKHLFIVRGKRR